MLTFDQWIDAVNQRVKARLSGSVSTQELSTDGAWWIGAGGNAAAALAEDGETAKISCDGTRPFSVVFREPQGDPAVVGDRIADRLSVIR